METSYELVCIKEAPAFFILVAGHVLHAGYAHLSEYFKVHFDSGTFWNDQHVHILAGRVLQVAAPRTVPVQSSRDGRNEIDLHMTSCSEGWPWHGLVQTS